MKRLLILLILFYCGCHTKEQNILPAERPKDFVLYYNSNGTMMDHSESIDIEADSCVYNIRDNGKETHRLFTLSLTEMDSLYSMLKKNSFDKIEYTTESQVSDRGGVSIRVNWNNYQQRILVDDSQGAFVNKNWENEWEGVCAYVEKLAKER